MLCARERFSLHVATLFTVFVGSYTLELWPKGLCNVAQTHTPRVAHARVYVAVCMYRSYVWCRQKPMELRQRRQLIEADPTNVCCKLAVNVDEKWGQRNRELGVHLKRCRGVAWSWRRRLLCASCIFTAVLFAFNWIESNENIHCRCPRCYFLSIHFFFLFFFTFMTVCASLYFYHCMLNSFFLTLWRMHIIHLCITYSSSAMYFHLFLGVNQFIQWNSVKTFTLWKLLC